VRPFDAREQEPLVFLYELYKRSAGDARQDVPDEAMIDALGFGEMDHARWQSRHQMIGMTLQGVRLMEDLFVTLNPAPPQPSVSLDHTTTV
jgi:hypothetical protein